MNRILGTAATAAVLGMSALAFASPAQAAGDNIYIVDGTYSQCLDKQRTYVTVDQDHQVVLQARPGLRNRLRVPLDQRPLDPGAPGTPPDVVAGRR